MNIKDQLTKNLKTAMKEKNKMKTRVIRMALSSIKLAEVEVGGELDENRILAILQKEIKTREETIAEAEKANRPEMIKELNEEIAAIKEFLPTEIDDEALGRIIDEVIAMTKAESIKQMGLVMKESISRVAGRASNDRISKIVKEKLS